MSFEMTRRGQSQPHARLWWCRGSRACAQMTESFVIIASAARPLASEDGVTGRASSGRGKLGRQTELRAKVKWSGKDYVVMHMYRCDDTSAQERERPVDGSVRGSQGGILNRRRSVGDRLR